MFQERGTASLGQAMPPKPAESREGNRCRELGPSWGTAASGTEEAP